MELFGYCDVIWLGAIKNNDYIKWIFAPISSQVIAFSIDKEHYLSVDVAVRDLHHYVNCAVKILGNLI